MPKYWCERHANPENKIDVYCSIKDRKAYRYCACEYGEECEYAKEYPDCSLCWDYGGD